MVLVRYMKINILLMLRVLNFYVSNIIMTNLTKNYIENICLFELQNVRNYLKNVKLCCFLNTVFLIDFPATVKRKIPWKLKVTTLFNEKTNENIFEKNFILSSIQLHTIEINRFWHGVLFLENKAKRMSVNENANLLMAVHVINRKSNYILFTLSFF